MKFKVIILIICTFILFAIVGCKDDAYSTIKVVKTNVVCIEGHVYYERYDALAIKLNDDGKPCKCE